MNGVSGQAGVCLQFTPQGFLGFLRVGPKHVWVHIRGLGIHLAHSWRVCCWKAFPPKLVLAVGSVFASLGGRLRYNNGGRNWAFVGCLKKGSPFQLMLENVSKDIFQNNNLRKQLKAKPELPLPSQHRTLCVTPHLWCLHFGLAFEDSDNESESKKRSKSTGKRKSK